MAHVLDDRVRETSASTGTGAFTLSGAVSGYKSFGSRMSVSDTTFYAIVGGTEWEVGLGTYSNTNELTRTAVFRSSNSDAAVNFSGGSKDVFINLPAFSGMSSTGKQHLRNSMGLFGAVAVQVFTASGTYTPTSGMKYCRARGVAGAGGGGGCTSSSASRGSGGGGGQAGGYAEKWFSASDIGASKAVAIGAGGTGAATGNNPGNAGGDTTLGTTLLVAKGGAGGAGGSDTGFGAGGQSLTAGTGEFTSMGAPGGHGFGIDVGVSGASIPTYGGDGGSSPFGSGGRGPISYSAANGNAGNGYGAGGSGGQCIGATTSGGGNATSGILIIEEFF